MSGKLVVRPLTEQDLDEADKIERLAFGTFAGSSDPLHWMGDAGHVHSRWRAKPESAFAAELDGRLIGSNFATGWGSFASFGPLTIHPDHWGRGFAKALIAPAIELIDSWNVAQTGIFTFAHSVKHIVLYQRFGFRPRSLTAILDKPLAASASGAAWSTYSQMTAPERRAAANDCRTLTDGIFCGLDVTVEIESIAGQSLGDTVLVYDGTTPAGFAACHTGPGSEAGSESCFVKFAASRTADGAAGLARLLDACESFGIGQGAQRLIVGVSIAREEAYELMLDRGFRFVRTGLAMHRPNEPGFSRAGVFVLDDWR